MIEEECKSQEDDQSGNPLYLSPSRAIYRRISQARNLKVCCDRSSCLTEFVILLGERADVASEVLDLEGSCFSRGKLGLMPSSGLSSALCPARGLVRPCAIIIIIISSVRLKSDDVLLFSIVRLTSNFIS